MDNQTLAIIVAAAGTLLTLSGYVVNRFFDQWLDQSKEQGVELGEIAKTLAVISHRVGEVEKDLNSVGRGVRQLRDEMAALGHPKGS